MQRRLKRRSYRKIRAKIQNKGGRPAKAVRREHWFSIRFTQAKHLTVKGKAAITGLSFTVYLRKMVLHRHVKARQSEDKKQIVKQLIGMAFNSFLYTISGFTAILLHNYSRPYFCSCQPST